MLMNKYTGPNHYVMDFETLVNCFVAVFEHYKTDEVKVFAICSLKNDLIEFLNFLKRNIKNNEFHISFNGLSFDAQITQYIILNRDTLLQMTGERAANMIYAKAQECITKSNNREFPQWSENKLLVKQIDLFKLNHWDNPAKRSSLKSIQVAMDWPNVQDMPIPHTTEITTVTQLKEIAQYCRNDVASTKHIMKLCQGQINLRGTLTQTYNIPLFSASEPRLAKELFLMFLSQKTGADPYELKKLRTHRKIINFKDIILPYIKFDLPPFQKLLANFKAIQLDPKDTKGGFKERLKYRGLVTDFGLGGVHAAKKGIYTAKDGMIIMSSDVVSYYPRLAMVNKWCPAHLPLEAFCEQYEWFFVERRKIPKSNPKNYVYKIVLNSAYGLTNDKHCFLYDPEMTMKITVNGQLSLMMLYTMLAEGIPGAIPIMQNTDGLEMIIPEKEKQNYLAICEKWQKLTKLELEHDTYQKLIIPDVNTYVGVFTYREIKKEVYEKLLIEQPQNLYKIHNNKYYHAPTKLKGRYDFLNLALHKNKSFLIIRKALFYFFVHGVKPEQFLENNQNIYDYCGAVKSRGDWQLVESYIEDGSFIETVLQKTVRYYISNKGSKIVKHNRLDKRKIQTESGPCYQTVFNVYKKKPWSEYNINNKYYLNKIYKEIENLMPELFNNQMSLF